MIRPRPRRLATRSARSARRMRSSRVVAVARRDRQPGIGADLHHLIDPDRARDRVARRPAPPPAPPRRSAARITRPNLSPRSRAISAPSGTSARSRLAISISTSSSPASPIASFISSKPPRSISATATISSGCAWRAPGRSHSPHPVQVGQAGDRILIGEPLHLAGALRRAACRAGGAATSPAARSRAARARSSRRTATAA